MMNVDKLVETCYNAIPISWRKKPWEYLNHVWGIKRRVRKDDGENMGEVIGC